MLLKNHKIKSIDLLDIIGDLFYSLNRSLLARTAIRLVVRALFIPAQLPFSRSYAFCM
jgi:hypothetical protein